VTVPAEVFRPQFSLCRWEAE